MWKEELMDIEGRMNGFGRKKLGVYTEKLMEMEGRAEGHLKEDVRILLTLRI